MPDQHFDSFYLLNVSMVKMSGVHNFFAVLYETPRNFVAFNAENELIETEKSLQKDRHGELEVRRPTK